jgi:SGNH hydrolase-like domain, acetyltransferase AlgX
MFRRFFPFLALLLSGLTAGAGSAEECVEHCRAVAAQALAKQQRVVRGAEEGWLFPAAEIQHLGLGKWWESPASGVTPQQAILAYHEALKALGVHLVLAPVPARAAVERGKWDSAAAGEPGVVLGDMVGFFDSLRAAGVTVVDLLPVLRGAAEAPSSACVTDSHWSPLGAERAARAIWAAVASKGGLPARPLAVPSPVDETIHFSGDLISLATGPAVAPESQLLHRPYAVPVPSAETSPFLLLGDSHTLVFSEPAASVQHHTTGAGVRDHLQALSGNAWSVAANASGGATAARALVARKAQAQPSFWTGRHTVVWCFAAREFTASRWQLIPAQPGR